MDLLELVVKLVKLYGEHGNIPVKIDCYDIDRIENVQAIHGEHGAYIDIQSTEPSVTIEEAMKLYAGVTREQFQRYILHGKLRARKVGRQWLIPITELERMFLPR